jgi:endonuclease/exonuclease/phosphatase family metal-dependent hydrolase
MKRLCLVVSCWIAAGALHAAPDHVEVATWNLEWFNHGQRGFPENGHGGPTYGPRSAQGLATIGYLIAQKHGLDVVGLQEIQSAEDLEALLPYLPATYRMHVVADDATQHCALLWDSAVVTVQIEPPVAALAVSRRQRQGLHAVVRCRAFTCDFLVVHLANDDAQVARQVDLMQQWVRGTLGQSPRRDDDAVIGGDLNLTANEAPLQTLIADTLLGWCFLGLAELPPTRAVSGKTIDHLFITRDCYDHQRLGEAEVPREDLWFGESYRELISDHLPVIQSFRTTAD